jgi:integrase
MSIIDRNGWKYYDFWWRSVRYQGACHTKNTRVAEQIEAAKKTELALAKVGIVKQASAPTLEAFKQRFLDHIKAQKPDKTNTYNFYEDMYQALLRFKPLAESRLDRIDEELIDRYQQYALKIQDPKNKRPVLPATINRRIAALRRALYLAYKWKLINRAPTFTMLGGERKRTFVVTPVVHQAYLESAPEPLRTIEVFGMEDGLRLEEIVSLTWPQVFMEDKPDEDGLFGYLKIVHGKSENAKRDFPITATMREVLLQQKKVSQSEFVFVRQDRKTPVSKWTLDKQQARLRKKFNLPWDATIHSFRHSVATRLGLSGADPFTMQKLMGWSSITVAEKYVHPIPEAKRAAMRQLKQFDDMMRAPLHMSLHLESAFTND